MVFLNGHRPLIASEGNTHEVSAMSPLLLASIFDGVQLWLSQLSRLLQHQMQTLGPQQYCVMLVVCIASGVFLLRGQR